MDLIIDGSNLLHRSFWVAEKNVGMVDVTTSEVSFMFLKSVKALAQKFKPENIWVTWDKRLTLNSTNFRKKLLPDVYKATRDSTRNDKVIAHHSRIHELLNTLGVKQIYPNVLEADDIISWLTKKIKSKTIIISVDKDLLQLVDTNVEFYNPIKKQLINKHNFYDIIGVEAVDYVKYKALLGDNSDNVDGVVGYGPQKCKRLCTESIDTIQSALIEDQFNIFKRNYTVMDLSNSYDNEEGEADIYEQQFKEQVSLKSNFKKFENLCDKLNIQGVLKDLTTWKRYFVSEQNMSDLISKLLTI